jgi:hypothetical protein
MASVEQSVEWELAGVTEVLGENLPQYHFIHHKSHMTWPGLEPEEEEEEGEEKEEEKGEVEEEKEKEESCERCN